MKRKVLIVSILFIAACSTAPKLKEAKQIEPTGTEFQKTLYKEYITKAETEQKEGDIDQAEFYAQRAITAGSGKRVLPYEVDENGLPRDTVPAFKTARERLNIVLNRGARKEAPIRTARAQASYDCWLAEVELTADMDRIEACRDRFRQNISEVEEILDQKQP